MVRVIRLVARCARGTKGNFKDFVDLKAIYELNLVPNSAFFDEVFNEGARESVNFL